MMTPFAWGRYSRKLKAKIDKPSHGGCFTAKESAERGMRFAEGWAGSSKEGHQVCITWMVDPDDGVIVDARFQLFGPTPLIGAAEVACELIIRKNYDQARRITVDLIDKQVRDKAQEAAFPWECATYLNLVLDAIDEAADSCTDISLPTSYAAPPVPQEEISGEEGYPGWEELSDPQKRGLIEEVLNRDVRPYIALDAGGVEVIDFSGNAIIIEYQGSCTSCLSSVGATLGYIQQTLRKKLSPALNVIPK